MANNKGTKKCAERQCMQHPQDYFSAVARLQDISPHFHIDLVNLDCCTTGQQVLIDAEGHPL